MARSFGGRFSPGRDAADGAGASAGPAIRHRLASRPKWVTIASVPLLFGAFAQAPLGMVTDLASFGLIASAMWMTGQGLTAEAAYQVRRVARRPAIPRKLFGGVLAGVGLGLGAADPGALADAGLIGAAGLVLHGLAFGLDPMRDKGATGVDNFQQDRAHRMIDEAEDVLASMQDAIRRAGDRRIEARVTGFAATVRALFDRVRDNPGDLGAARRYLGVYLQGARDATVKFADLHARRPDPAVRSAYETFLNDLERNFTARIDKLLEGDKGNLDIEIAVLRDRLAREGVPVDDAGNDAPVPGQAQPARLTSEAARSFDDLLRGPAEKVPSGRK